ncbi:MULTISPECIES: permease [Paraliobacillus]|uniref:permease n=1 Tax=Paraliobacillus TaxID=200903 RepID=UPI000DD411BD|nr:MULTISPECIES: permease [Paraliobacillus]
MIRGFRSFLIDFSLVILVGLAVYVLSFGDSFSSIIQLPNSVFHMNTIFLSILIEALPFVLIGVLIAGIIQIFVTEDHIKRWIPKNPILAIIMSCFVGALFPACECGIVPIVRRLLAKGVPIHAGIGFLLTGPLINPLVILSTYMAFGNDFKIAASRMILGFLIAVLISIIISVMFKSNQLKHTIEVQQTHTISHNHGSQSIFSKLGHTVTHAVDEFFDMGKYLIVGALLAAFVQTYVSSEALLELGSGQVSSTAVMMGLAYLLSLCSEADAFIAASFSNVFPTTAILGFLIYGPMTDLKNTMMMLSVFKTRFVILFVLIVTIVVFSVLTLLDGFY